MNLTKSPEGKFRSLIIYSLSIDCSYDSFFKTREIFRGVFYAFIPNEINTS